MQSRICYGNTRESQCMHGPRHTSSTAAVSYFIHVSADKLNILVQAHRSPQTPDITTWYISSGNLAEHMYPTTPRPKVLWTESGGRSRPNKNLAEISREISGESSEIAPKFSRGFIYRKISRKENGETLPKFASFVGLAFLARKFAEFSRHIFKISREFSRQFSREFSRTISRINAV